MKTDKLTKFIMRCLLALSLGGVGQAYAGVCEISLEANPPFPETIASTLGWGIASPLNGSKVGEPQITLTPTVPRIVSGSASSDQNCKPVLRSSITIPNLKTP
jgi:hypothetical protein